MNTRHLGIRFKPGLDRKTGELLAAIASGSQRISAPDGAKKFSVRPHLSAESLSHSRGALQAMIGESLAESAEVRKSLLRSPLGPPGRRHGVLKILCLPPWCPETRGGAAEFLGGTARFGVCRKATLPAPSVKITATSYYRKRRKPPETPNSLRAHAFFRGPDAKVAVPESAGNST